MKLRIAIWAVVGAFVVALWSVYFMVNHTAPHGAMLTFLCLTCPIALARQHPMSVYVALLTNTVTYAMVGAIIETIRRHFRNAHPIAH